MCGRFENRLSLAEIVALYGLRTVGTVPNLKPRADIRPTETIPAVRMGAAGRELAMLRWWLVPSWAKEAGSDYPMFNARAETIATRKSFAGPFRHRRCLIPASGFYEWRKDGTGRRTRFLITAHSGAPLSFAGIWERNEHLGIESCAIITTPANRLMRPIHDRMPAIIDPRDHAAWLEAPRSDLLRPAPEGLLIAFPVRSDIGDDDPPEALPQRLF